MIAVRPATGDDVAFVAATQAAPHARGFVHPATEDEVRAALARDDRATFVVTENDVPAGMLLLGCDPGATWLVELRRIVVMQPGRGIGEWAIRWAIAWAFDDRGAHRIWLDVVEANTRARRVYDRCGFRNEGTYRDGYRAADGTYGNLCIYGMLATDERPMRDR